MMLSWLPKTYIKAAPASSVIYNEVSMLIDNSYQYLDDIPGRNKRAPIIANAAAPLAKPDAGCSVAINCLL